MTLAAKPGPVSQTKSELPLLTPKILESGATSDLNQSISRVLLLLVLLCLLYVF